MIPERLETTILGTFTAPAMEKTLPTEKHDLLELECSAALEVDSLDKLCSSLRLMSESCNRIPFPGFMTKLEPSFQHLTSFVNAITSAS
jgi:hypothetical protein